MSQKRKSATPPEVAATPARAEMSDVGAIYRYQSEPVSGLAAAPAPEKDDPTAPLYPLAESRWASE